MALAAAAQAVSLVQKLARQGSCDNDDLYSVIKGVLITHPQQPSDVYKDSNLDAGYRLVIELLGDASSNKDPELTRYLIGLLALERRLAKRRDVLALMGERIEQVKRQVGHYGLEDEKVLANLADIYVELISPLGARIQVAGSPIHLQQSLNQHKVRAALLAGIRALVLWRQLGGSRWQLLFKRRALVDEARQSLRSPQ
ncbi:high frequency lysogenization protein HflD [Gallaecimonas xiamenensis]|uniref:High frequency lysogenization protein HflD homolog n=1 Tax=Gallaecimonas xiamenensis 3-C-1 TaxID=745411 RepID=K2K4T5_9GAMM|nr:high frequency lysogenization protein HflD [Gallaecimonas xiamenensis]EKE77974.1 lysogenization regulator [Gallaecimonas xiamenensis 3-C-1]